MIFWSNKKSENPPHRGSAPRSSWPWPWRTPRSGCTSKRGATWSGGLPFGDSLRWHFFQNPPQKKTFLLVANPKMFEAFLGGNEIWFSSPFDLFFHPHISVRFRAAVPRNWSCAVDFLCHPAAASWCGSWHNTCDTRTCPWRCSESWREQLSSGKKTSGKISDVVVQSKTHNNQTKKGLASWNQTVCKMVVGLISITRSNFPQTYFACS